MHAYVVDGGLVARRPAADERPCAREILSTLARSAYRRPVTDADVQTLLDFYEAGRREGSFDRGIGFALERLLTDPDFLYRIERDPVDAAPATAYPVGDVEFASRLSFFLWSSMPDDELLAHAERGTISCQGAFSSSSGEGWPSTAVASTAISGG